MLLTVMVIAVVVLALVTNLGAFPQPGEGLAANTESRDNSISRAVAPKGRAQCCILNMAKMNVGSRFWQETSTYTERCGFTEYKIAKVPHEAPIPRAHPRHLRLNQSVNLTFRLKLY